MVNQCQQCNYCYGLLRAPQVNNTAGTDNYTLVTTCLCNCNHIACCHKNNDLYYSMNIIQCPNAISFSVCRLSTLHTINCSFPLFSLLVARLCNLLCQLNHELHDRELVKSITYSYFSCLPFLNMDTQIVQECIKTGNSSKNA